MISLPIDSAVWWAYTLLLIYAMIIDVRRYTIPNFVVAILAVVGVASIAINVPDQLTSHLLVGGVAFVTGFLLFRLANMGAGDAKLVAVVMLWAGPGPLPLLLLAMAVACAALVLLLLAGRWIAAKMDADTPRWLPLKRGAPVPLALAISPAAIFASLGYPPELW